MKNVIFPIVAFICFTSFLGCNNLSPRLDPKQDQKIENDNGHIGEIDTLANSMKAEIGKLQSQADIQNSKLDHIQQGLANFQYSADNSGVQIFSGPGGIMVAIVGFTCIALIILHYRRTAQIQEKTANILAERITSQNNPALEESVFQAVMYSDVEENVLHLMKKHKANLAKYPQ